MIDPHNGKPRNWEEWHDVFISESRMIKSPNAIYIVSLALSRIADNSSSRPSLCIRAGPRGIAEQKPRKPGRCIIQFHTLNNNEIPSSLSSASNTSLQPKSLTVNYCFPQHPLQLLPRGIPVQRQHIETCPCHRIPGRIFSQTRQSDVQTCRSHRRDSVTARDE